MGSAHCSFHQVLHQRNLEVIRQVDLNRLSCSLDHRTNLLNLFSNSYSYGSRPMDRLAPRLCITTAERRGWTCHAAQTHGLLAAVKRGEARA